MRPARSVNDRHANDCLLDRISRECRASNKGNEKNRRRRGTRQPSVHRVHIHTLRIIVQGGAIIVAEQPIDFCPLRRYADRITLIRPRPSIIPTDSWISIRAIYFLFR